MAMNKVGAVGVLALCVVCAAAAQVQGPTGAPQRVPVAPPPANLNAILLEIQHATSSASVNIGKLRIEKWKTDSAQKQQLQQIAESLQKNIANAVPGLINDVQTSRGGALASFKLYHNLNVLYEFLSGLADAAGSLRGREEYEPLAADAAALDTARQHLATYIEQTVGRLESSVRPATGTIPVPARQTPDTAPHKVVVIDDDQPPPKKPVKSTKKKTSAPPASATPTPAQSAGSPH
jgi:hypothetical protein